MQKSIRAEFQIERDDLTDAELGKAWDIARRVIAKHVSRAPWWIDAEALQSEARLGFLEACRNYACASRAQLSTFTTRRVLTALLDEERKQSPWTRRQTEQIRRNQAAGLDLEPWMVDAESFEGAAVSNRRAAPSAIDRDGMTEGLGQEALRSLVADLLGTVTKRHREVLIRYFYGGQIYRDIGKSMGVSESRVHQLRNEAFATLRQTFPNVEALL